jgi:hypothetical protein
LYRYVAPDRDLLDIDALAVVRTLGRAVHAECS